jgi:hypothetical protein
MRILIVQSLFSDRIHTISLNRVRHTEILFNGLLLRSSFCLWPTVFPRSQSAAAIRGLRKRENYHQDLDAAFLEALRD